MFYMRYIHNNNYYNSIDNISAKETIKCTHLVPWFPAPSTTVTREGLPLLAESPNSCSLSPLLHRSCASPLYVVLYYLN
jgi:hypothetical protein